MRIENRSTELESYRVILLSESERRSLKRARTIADKLTEGLGDSRGWDDNPRAAIEDISNGVTELLSSREILIDSAGERVDKFIWYVGDIARETQEEPKP